MGTYAYHSNNLHFPVTRCLYLAESDNLTVLKIGCSMRPLERLKTLKFDRGPVCGETRYVGIGFSVGTHVDEARLIALAKRVSQPIAGYERFAWSEHLKAYLKPFFSMTAEEAVKVAAERRAVESLQAEKGAAA